VGFAVRGGGVDVAATVDPAIDFDVAVFEPLAEIRWRERLHERPALRVRYRCPDCARAAERPLGEWIGRSGLWLRRQQRRWPPTRRRVGIGHGRLSPFVDIRLDEKVEWAQALGGVCRRWLEHPNGET